MAADGLPCLPTTHASFALERLHGQPAVLELQRAREGGVVFMLRLPNGQRRGGRMSRREFKRLLQEGLALLGTDGGGS